MVTKPSLCHSNTNPFDIQMFDTLDAQVVLTFRETF